MIHFNKLTDYQSETQVNCQTIGKLERVANEFYHIEILYDYETTIPVKDKRLIVGLIERIYQRHLAREQRELIGMYKMRNRDRSKMKVVYYEGEDMKKIGLTEYNKQIEILE